MKVHRLEAKGELMRERRRRVSAGTSVEGFEVVGDMAVFGGHPGVKRGVS